MLDYRLNFWQESRATADFSGGEQNGEYKNIFHPLSTPFFSLFRNFIWTYVNGAHLVCFRDSCHIDNCQSASCQCPLTRTRGTCEMQSVLATIKPLSTSQGLLQ
jgi:hypothetical protein